MVPRAGLEPARPLGHSHLKAARLPISPPRLKGLTLELSLVELVQ